ncbi:hypothetical protein [Pararobbsia silviterrae]|nr:hypothetical protein [Pararobbsia silviterrae]
MRKPSLGNVTLLSLFDDDAARARRGDWGERGASGVLGFRRGVRPIRDT